MHRHIYARHYSPRRWCERLRTPRLKACYLDLRRAPTRLLNRLKRSRWRRDLFRTRTNSTHTVYESRRDMSHAELSQGVDYLLVRIVGGDLLLGIALQKINGYTALSRHACMRTDRHVLHSSRDKRWFPIASKRHGVCRPLTSRR